MNIINNKKIVSIIISLYNEEGNILELYNGLKKNLQLTNVDHEIIFVNDGSNDKTLQICKEIMNHDKNVKIMNFLKNFGHEVAMRAGLDVAIGDALIFMDGDLQHPPEMLPLMIEKWKNGSEIVLTKRIDDEGKSIFNKILVKLYYTLINFISDIKIPANTPDFRLISKKYANFLKQMQEQNTMFRGLLMITGVQKESYIDFIAPKRFSGQSHYNIFKLIKLAVDSMIQFSIKPLRLATFTGILSAFVSLLLGLYTIFEYYINGTNINGYPTTICIIVFVASIQMIMLGILGEYIGRIHMEIKKRPMYFGELLENKNDQ